MTVDKEAIWGITKNLQKNFREDIVTYGKKIIFNENPLPCGVKAIDLLLNGGFPAARVSEVFGDHATGKTMLALRWLAETQRRGGIAIFFAAEDPLNTEFAKLVGLDLENLIYLEPNTLEEMYSLQAGIINELKEKMPNTNVAIVTDSIAQLDSDAAFEVEEIDPKMNVSLGKARINSAAMRKIPILIKGSNIAILYINQLREKPGVMFGSPFDTSGGRAMKYATSVRLQIHTGKKLKDDQGQIIGTSSKVELVKSKVCAPFKCFQMEIIFKWGVQDNAGLLDLLKKEGLVISKTGGHYSCMGISFRSSAKDHHRGFSDWIDENPTVWEDIEAVGIYGIGMKPEEESE